MSFHVDGVAMIIAVTRLIAYAVNDDKHWRRFLFLVFLLLAVVGGYSLATAHSGPVTGRLRSPPYPAAAPASTTAKPSASRRCANRREDVTATEPERRALSGSAPPASRAPEDRF